MDNILEEIKKTNQLLERLLILLGEKPIESVAMREKRIGKMQSEHPGRYTS